MGSQASPSQAGTPVNFKYSKICNDASLSVCAFVMQNINKKIVLNRNDEYLSLALQGNTITGTVYDTAVHALHAQMVALGASEERVPAYVAGDDVTVSGMYMGT